MSPSWEIFLLEPWTCGARTDDTQEQRSDGSNNGHNGPKSYPCLRGRRAAKLGLAAPPTSHNAGGRQPIRRGSEIMFVNMYCLACSIVVTQACQGKYRATFQSFPVHGILAAATNTMALPSVARERKRRQSLRIIVVHDDDGKVDRTGHGCLPVRTCSAE
jgi:hypothetical protein